MREVLNRLKSLLEPREVPPNPIPNGVYIAREGSFISVTYLGTGRTGYLKKGVDRAAVQREADELFQLLVKDGLRTGLPGVLTTPTAKKLAIFFETYCKKMPTIKGKRN